jgi:hypothetical protein
VKIDMDIFVKKYLVCCDVLYLIMILFSLIHSDHRRIKFSTKVRCIFF